MWLTATFEIEWIWEAAGWDSVPAIWGPRRFVLVSRRPSSGSPLAYTGRGFGMGRLVLRLAGAAAAAAFTWICTLYLFARVWGVGPGAPGSLYAEEHANGRALPIALVVFAVLVVWALRQSSREREITSDACPGCGAPVLKSQARCPKCERRVRASLVADWNGYTPAAQLFFVGMIFIVLGGVCICGGYWSFPARSESSDDTDALIAEAEETLARAEAEAERAAAERAAARRERAEAEAQIRPTVAEMFADIDEYQMQEIERDLECRSPSATSSRQVDLILMRHGHDTGSLMRSYLSCAVVGDTSARVYVYLTDELLRLLPPPSNENGVPRVSVRLRLRIVAREGSRVATAATAVL